MKLAVLGAGAWGTAVAAHACRSQATWLWARDPSQAAAIEAQRRNDRYLPEVVLPEALRVTADFDAALAGADLVLIATPMAALDAVLRRLPPAAAPVLWLCKGFQEGTGWLGHEVARDASPHARVGVLSGPSFAIEV
ncbi:MAG: 2-dehydropantoate 2-reductase N-terminal domain-containing protein, partial [Rhizobacter sp.]